MGCSPPAEGSHTNVASVGQPVPCTSRAAAAHTAGCNPALLNQPCCAFAHPPLLHTHWAGLQTDLTTKLKLKLAAIAALPPHLAAAAQVPDDELFPLNRQMFNDTPPIEGFGQAPVAAQQGGRKLGTKHR